MMNKLEETDKDMWYLERDFKAAETEYLKCKARFDKVKSAKVDLVGQMTALTLNAEQKKTLAEVNTYFNSVKTMHGDFIQFGPNGERAEGKFAVSCEHEERRLGGAHGALEGK